MLRAHSLSRAPSHELRCSLFELCLGVLVSEKLRARLLVLFDGFRHLTFIEYGREVVDSHRGSTERLLLVGCSELVQVALDGVLLRLRSIGGVDLHEHLLHLRRQRHAARGDLCRADLEHAALPVRVEVDKLEFLWDNVLPCLQFARPTQPTSELREPRDVPLADRKDARGVL